MKEMGWCLRRYSTILKLASIACSGVMCLRIEAARFSDESNICGSDNGRGGVGGRSEKTAIGSPRSISSIDSTNHCVGFGHANAVG